MDAIASPGGSLGEIDERRTRNLYASLWDWNLCASCYAGLDTACDTFSCPSHRINQLGPFNDLYREATSRYLPEFTASSELALRNHDDLIELIRFIRNKTTIPRHQLTADYFTERARRENRQEQPDIHDQERAISLAGRILTMVNFSTESNHAEALIEEGSRVVSWTSTDSLAKFVSRSFPMTDHPESQRSKQSSNQGRRIEAAA